MALYLRVVATCLLIAPIMAADSKKDQDPSVKDPSIQNPSYAEALEAVGDTEDVLVKRSGEFKYTIEKQKVSHDRAIELCRMNWGIAVRHMGYCALVHSKDCPDVYLPTNPLDKPNYMELGNKKLIFENALRAAGYKCQQ